MSMPQIYSVSDIVPKLGDHLQQRSIHPELGLNTMPQLSSKIHGLKRKKLTVIGARPSHGKTSFIEQVALDLALQSQRVLFISLEMSNEDMVERLFCNWAKANNEHIMKGRFNEYANDYLKFTEALKDIPFAFSDCMGKNWMQIDDQISKMKLKPDVVIVDYIQAIKGTSISSERGMIDEYIKKFREMAVIHNFAGILMSQINRSNESSKETRPKLHQLKGTGFLEEHADIVMLLYWPYKADFKTDKGKNFYMVDVAKNRNGPTGLLPLMFYPEYYLFTDPQCPKPEAEVAEAKKDKKVQQTLDEFQGTIVEGHGETKY